MFKFYKQYNSMDCGPTCLKMIIKFYGKEISLQTLRELCNLDREGVSINAIINASEKIGLNAIGLKSIINKSNDIDNIPLLEELSLPLIAFWNNNHFVVIYKIKKGKVYIADPATGIYSIELLKIKEHLFSENNYAKVILFEPTPLFNNSKNQYFENQLIFNNLKFINKHVLSNKKGFLFLLFLIFLKLIFQSISPYLTQKTFDTGILQKNLNVLVTILLFQLLIFTFNSAISYFEGIISIKISRKINISFLSEFVQKLFKIPYNYYQQKKTSDFIYRIFDFSKIESFLAYNLSNIILSLIGFIVLSAILIYYNFYVYIVFILFNVIYLGWIWYSLKKKREFNPEKFDIQMSTHHYITELIEGIQDIKIAGNDSQKIDSLITNQNRFYTNNLRNNKVSQFFGIGGGLINNLGSGIITFYSAILVTNNTLSIGEMLAIQLLVSQLNSMVSTLFSSASSIQEVKFSLERIQEIQFVKNESIGVLPVNNVKSIIFKNLSFSYSEISEKVLQNIDFSIESNKTTAIVGTSGSGKTTLMKLALGLFTPTSGNITFDNIPIHEYNIKDWRINCGVVMQDGYLFTDTIINNITELDENINFDNYISALKLASIYDFVISLPIQHKTIIGKGGLKLSAGQRQRILIARAIYKNPDFLFMDEATNSLDSETERIIIDNLDSFFYNKTRLIIAHRLNTVKNADKIIVLKKGEIVEEGSHIELIQKNGYYYELVKEQLQLS